MRRLDVGGAVLIAAALLVAVAAIPAHHAAYADASHAEQWSANKDAAGPNELSVPAQEFLSYVDANGIYTIIGNVKNGYGHAVSPVVVLSVRDDSGITYHTIHHNAIAPGGELPFKAKMPDISGDVTISTTG